MSDVQQPVRTGQVGDFSSPTAPSLRWDDPAELRRWLRQLEAQTLDAVAIGEDAMKRFEHQFFSRAEQRRRLRESEAALMRLLSMAKRSLPGAPEEAGAPE